MLKPLTVWITKNYGKFLKRWEYQTTLAASWQNCMQVNNQQLELDIEQQTGSKLGKEYIKAVYCHSAYLTYMQSAMLCLVTQLCPTLCNPMDCSLPASSIHGVSQARILEWVAISLSGGSFQPRGWTHVSCTGRQILYPRVLSRSVIFTWAAALQAPTSVGILQARILEWLAISFSWGSSQPKDQTQVSRIVGRLFTSWTIRGAQEYWSG